MMDHYRLKIAHHLSGLLDPFFFIINLKIRLKQVFKINILYLSNQKENAFLATKPCLNMLSNTVSTSSTDIFLKAKPKMPSNLAATKVRPGC
jgi:hypothetical protein